MAGWSIRPVCPVSHVYSRVPCFDPVSTNLKFQHDSDFVPGRSIAPIRPQNAAIARHDLGTIYADPEDINFNSSQPEMVSLLALAKKNVSLRMVGEQVVEGNVGLILRSCGASENCVLNLYAIYVVHNHTKMENGPQ